MSCLQYIQHRYPLLRTAGPCTFGAEDSFRRNVMRKCQRPTEISTRIKNAAITEASPASVSIVRPIDSPRDRVECVAESPATRSIEGDMAGVIVSNVYM
jgi:hypothetical protein